MDDDVRAELPGASGRLGVHTRRLGLVMALPLVDGVFVTLVLAGVLESVAGIAMLGLVIFGGSATAAVVLADVGAEPGIRLREVALLGAILVPLAGIQATLAPSLAALFDVGLLKGFAALVLLVIAADLASARLRAFLPRPGLVVLIGLLVSIQPRLDAFEVALDAGLLLRGASAALVGTAVVAALVVAGPRIRHLVDVPRLRYGSGISLGVLAVALIGSFPEIVAMVVLVVAGVLAINPQASTEEPGTRAEVDRQYAERPSWMQ